MNRISQHEEMRRFLIEMGEAVCDGTQDILRCKSVAQRTTIHEHSGSDVIYSIDRDAEAIIVRMMEGSAGRFGGIVLVAEGIGKDEISCYPDGMSMEDASWRMIMDPIDGTRGIMYNKRPAFFLAGAAPNKGRGTRLSDIEVAVMVEIPTTKMYLGDTLSAIKGDGFAGTRRNLLDGTRTVFEPQPTNEPTIRGGFAQVARFFGPGRDVLAKIEEELLETLFPDAKAGEILSFEDQYISTGGQLYEIMTGKDRFIADIRLALYNSMAGKMRCGHICHPYDLAALLVATEAGIRVTGIDGKPFDAPMETTLPVDWIAYANDAIFAEVSPVLGELLMKHGFC